MPLLDLVPTNTLERYLIEAKRGEHSIDDLLDAIARSLVYVSSRTQVQQNAMGFSPLLFEHDGAQLVAAFSSLDRPEPHREVAGYALQMPGRDFITRLPAGFGFILNPGFVVQLIVAPHAVADFKAKLKTA